MELLLDKAKSSDFTDAKKSIFLRALENNTFNRFDPFFSLTGPKRISNCPFSFLAYPKLMMSRSHSSP